MATIIDGNEPFAAKVSGVFKQASGVFKQVPYVSKPVPYVLKPASQQSKPASQQSNQVQFVHPSEPTPKQDNVREIAAAAENKQRKGNNHTPTRPPPKKQHPAHKQLAAQTGILVCQEAQSL